MSAWSDGEPLASTWWWRKSQSFGEGGSLLQRGPHSVVPSYVGESVVSTGSRASVVHVTLVPEGDIHISTQDSV